MTLTNPSPRRSHRPMFGSLIAAAPVAGALLLATTTLATAQERAPALDEPIVLAEVTCKEIMIQDGSDRDRSISFLQGFVMAGIGTTEMTVNDLIDAETAFYDLCLDSPQASALEIMGTVTGPADE